MKVRDVPEPCGTRADEQPQQVGLAIELERAMSALKAGPLDCSLSIGRLETLKGRLLGNRLQVAILGQFKRGKSTFINALLGATVLPVAVVPLTAVAIFITWGATPLARVIFNGARPVEEIRSNNARDIQEFLFRFVAEEQNPKNRLGVKRAELQYPSSVVRNGMTLIDTPGVGSSHQHNTEAAIQILPECDAAIFIVSADPPITEIELAYLKKIRSKAARIFFVLNKLDYLAPEDKTIAIDFLRKVISEHLLLEPSTIIFGISARNALIAKQNNDDDAFRLSGMAQVEDQLLPDLAAEKSRLLENAIRRKAADVISGEIEKIELRTKALTLPIEELVSRGEAFEAALSKIEEQRRTVRDLLTGEKRRLIELLERHTNELRERASSNCAAVVKQSLSGDNSGEWERHAQASISVVINEVFETARDRFHDEFAEQTAGILALHQRRFDRLIDSVRQTAAEIFNVSFSQPHERDTFELGEDPYWVTESPSMSLLPDPAPIIDRIVSLEKRRSRLYARLMKQIDELVIRNAENLRWAILRGIEETVLQAGDYFDEQMSQAIAATTGVIKDAVARRKIESSKTEQEIAPLEVLVGELRGIHDQLAQGFIEFC